MTSITWAGPRCVQELGTFLAPQNRIQGRCVMYIYSTTGEHQLHCAAAGVMFPLLISLPHCGYSALLALAALLGLSIAPLPTVTSGVITSLLGPDKLNDAFGELYLCPL